jgi:hypothetical protein
LQALPNSVLKKANDDLIGSHEALGGKTYFSTLKYLFPTSINGNDPQKLSSITKAFSLAARLGWVSDIPGVCGTRLKNVIVSTFHLQ